MAKIETARQIGAIIRSERSRQKLTQQQLADAADVSRALISRLEKGAATALYPEKLLAVLRALGLSLFVETDDTTIHAQTRQDPPVRENISVESRKQTEGTARSATRKNRTLNLLANADQITSSREKQSEPTITSPDETSLSAAEAAEQLASAIMSFNFSKTSPLLTPREGGEDK